MKILSIGHVTYDVTFPVNVYPKENTKNRYFDKEECVGGPASIASLLLGKWGENVSIAGMVGDDDYGRRIKKEFELNNVDTSYLVLREGMVTSSSTVLANRENGSRTIFSYVPKSMRLDKFKPTLAPDIILLDGFEYEASKELLRLYPNAISVIDAGSFSDKVMKLAKKVNYVVCSFDFALSATGVDALYDDKKSLVLLYQTLEDMFKGVVVITLEEYGCLYRYEGKIKIMPSMKVKTVDSTGAGDIFHGAFTYGIANGFDFEKNLKFSNIAGALSVTRVGGYKSIPSLEEMNEIYNEVK